MIPMTIADETIMTAVTSRHVNSDSLNLIPKYTGFPLLSCNSDELSALTRAVDFALELESNDQAPFLYENKKAGAKISGIFRQPGCLGETL